MINIEARPGRGRYLVSSNDSTSLGRFVAEAGRLPELRLERTIGPPEAPHTAVYDMPHASAAQLAQRFAATGELRIEPDQPLSLFDAPPY